MLLTAVLAATCPAGTIAAAVVLILLTMAPGAAAHGRHPRPGSGGGGGPAATRNSPVASSGHPGESQEDG
jgi:hypothetical protein